ncbi:hypothetical protein VTN00DRAFT_2191 [Thermoascus crustaceus]|uniref:uncharacterized protein n=1 Tax=Thermoascus crustaceus TaxID=5088 RepID=UPI003744A4D7
MQNPKAHRVGLPICQLFLDCQQGPWIVLAASYNGQAGKKEWHTCMESSVWRSETGRLDKSSGLRNAGDPPPRRAEARVWTLGAMSWPIWTKTLPNRRGGFNLSPNHDQEEQQKENPQVDSHG